MADLHWNTDRLVQISVAGEVAPPNLPGGLGATSFVVGHDGRAHLVPPWSGVTRNVRVGDPARGWLAERVEPGVSIRHRDHGHNAALLFFACIGNGATVMSGAAQGTAGVVTGKHGRFAETVMVQFSHDTPAKLSTGDRIVVFAWGTGLACKECEKARFKNLAPPVAERLVASLEGDAAVIPVRAHVPPELAGAGLGLSGDAGSLAIQTADERRLAAEGLNDLRLGDLVAFRDVDAEWTICFRRGAWSVGVVTAGDSVQAGYGVVTTIIATARDGGIKPVLTREASVAPYLTL